MPVSQLDICNLALVEIPAREIASVDENSQSAVECRRHYGQVVGEILEEFGYDLAVSRVVLAVTTNARSAEWAYAYSLPSDMASPLRIIPNYNTTTGAAVLLAGQTYAVTGTSNGDPWRIPFIIAGDVLFCNEPDATLEYVKSDPSIVLFPRLLIRAIALEMASRMVMPLLKSESREKVLIGKAEVAKQRAMADNLNRVPTTNYVPLTEDERARQGWY